MEGKFFTEEAYQDMISRLFVRFPSFQKAGASAYKPGIQNMEFFDQLLGHPHKQYKVVHVAGTNGKGSVSNMLASSLAAQGLRVGLYTSPHILDFRERMRVIDESAETMSQMVSKQDVWDFVQKWGSTFDHLDLSFFEITTSMAFDWFAAQKVDIAVIETGLGGRLDSTNIVTPVLSVITNIGLDHCDMLGDTLPEIAFEKAGIIKPCVPVVVGESHPEIDEVFERKVLYTNLPEVKFMGDRKQIMSLLTFADKVDPLLWDRRDEILAQMDLQGSYQEKNLRTVLTVLDQLGYARNVDEAIIRTAERADFHGRWEKLSDDPYIICDIGHNEHGLRYNFSQLKKVIDDGVYSSLIMVYGSVADKDVDAVIHLMPEGAQYVFTKAEGKRALEAQAIADKYVAFCDGMGRSKDNIYVVPDVRKAVDEALRLSSNEAAPIIYIGGSTYVVSEAVEYLSKKE